MANAIDAEIFSGFNKESESENPEFKRYLNYFKIMAKSEEYITWIYSVLYEKEKDKLVYAVDASPIDQDTVWLESLYFGIKFYLNQENQLAMFWDNTERIDQLKIKFKGKSFLFEIDQTNKELFLNREKILRVINTEPLSVESSNGTEISRNHLKSLFNFTYKNADNSTETIEINLNYSIKDQLSSYPGWEYFEADEITQKIKNAIKTCTFHMPSEPEQVSYGNFIIIIAPIHKNQSECIGAVLFAVSMNDITNFKDRITTIAIIINITCFFITLLLSYILSGYFTEPLTKLTEGVENLSTGNLNTNILITSKDEFGFLSEKFNEMVLNLRKAYEERESLVALRHELDIAQKIQMSILPKLTPSHPNLEIITNYIPMAQVGGDFYDFYILDKNKIGIFIADVSGHGVPAAIIASMLKIAFNIQIAFGEDPSRVLSRINKSMLNNVGQNFISASYIFLDLENYVMKHARAGHPSIFLHSSEKMDICDFNLKGKILGAFSEINSETVEIKLNKGDRIVLYTDGIIEARNSRNEMFGEELFIGYIKKHASLRGIDFSRLLINDIKSWVGNTVMSKNDDITLLVVDIK
jgi:serine phosphatase RsbU (regulator of sigma subunit)